ncbi:initiation factor 2B related protein [Marinobacter santoriniensis NKSG1]|uniref:Initiation factor 2B related protein n=1 Tax=Marinobacter santoriniensis NKSG1 TaxID=1288826 RepID=M7D1J8_9GAMM|nr:initiation factor 2B related protein [Marinobacter santoriniensis]EMP54628.1 initiation factor 2B related protein [Marinobacter santoriniensis NKSG1]
MDAQAEALLSALKNDHQSGATKLALRTLRDLADYLDKVGPSIPENEALLTALKHARPSMVVIGNAIGKVETRLRAQPERPGEAVRSVLQQLEQATNGILDHALAKIPDGAVIMTHSASSVVLALFRRLAREKRPVSVICTQSSPGQEGHGLARELDELAVPVTLITDAQMALFVGRADLVITGCDCWLADHHFINKAGTRLLALAARERGVPFWVLADSFRDSPETSRTVTLEEMPGEELQAPEGSCITPRNIYFETVPESLVSGRISEQGVSLFPAGARP